jgi:BirA family biotin operon repressor/biotin-[acetyl-CoA-carboxylase] ligase
VDRLRPVRPRTGTGPLGGPLIHLQTTSSTNDVCRAAARGGAPAGTVVLAETQQAGRGRQGRTWSSAPGTALTFSALARTDMAGFGLLPLVAALAVCEACEAAAPVACQIKWPNDVWIDRRKTAGILIEARPQEGWAVIGIGLNVSATAADLGEELSRTATSLELAAGTEVDRDQVLEALFGRLAERLEDLAHGRTEELLDRYRERDALTGKAITWTGSDEARTGTVQGIDQNGNLVVLTATNEQTTLESGEVHLTTTGRASGT